MTESPQIILIIDDSAEDRAVYQRYLTRRSHGAYRCVEAESGTVGLQLCRELWPACVLLDYRLPDMDGIMFLARLADECSEAPVPVILLTGVGSEALAVQALQSGARDYVSKHALTDERLYHVVHGTIEKALLQHEIQAQRAALHESEARLRLIWEHAPDAMMLSDADGLVLAANPAYYQLYGLDPDQVIGQSFATVLPEDKRECAVKRYREYFQNPSPPVEITIHRADGSTRVVESRINFLTIEGQCPSMLSIMRDITERKQTEERLRLFEQVVLTMSDALLITEAEPIDEPGPRITYMNPAFTRMTGYTLEDMRGKTPRILQGPLSSRAELDRVHAALSRWQPVHAELINYRKDGSAFEVEFDIVPVADASGWFTHWVSVQRDITEHKRATAEREHLLAQEQAARAAAEQAATRLTRVQKITAALAEALTPQQIGAVALRETLPLLGAHAGIIAVLSQDGSQLEVLERCAEAIQDSDACLYMYLDAPLPLTDVVRSREPIWLENRERALARYPALEHVCSISQSWAVLPLHVDQRVIGGWSLSFATPQAFTQEDRDLMLMIARQYAQALDRAHLYMLAEQSRVLAEEAVQVRDQFLSVAAHELKNPLTALIGNTQLLERHASISGGLSPRDQQRLRSITTQAGRLNQMLTTLLDVSQIEMGRLTITRTDMDLAALVARIVAETRQTLTRHILVCQHPATPLIVYGDALRLEQVLQNLLSNALKYSPAGGTVSVLVEQRQQQVYLQITDQGIGIPAHALPHIFQRFYRGEGTEAHQISGSGIGLYVVKEIIALHGGQVTVESQEGRGSTFTICLPLVAGAGSRAG